MNTTYTSANNDKNNHKMLSVLAILVILYVMRNAVPYMIFPLTLSVLCFGIFTLFYKKKVQLNVWGTIKTFFPFFILITIEFIAILNSYGYFEQILDITYLKELVFISIFLYFFYILVDDLAKIKYFIQQLSLFFFYIACFIAIASIIKYFYFIEITGIKVAEDTMKYILGTSLTTDYNFFGLFIFNGLSFGLFALFQNKFKRPIFIIAILAILASVAIMTGSRRTIFLVFILYFVVIFLAATPFLYKHFFSRETYKTTFIFLIFNIVMLAGLYLFITTYQGCNHKISHALKINTALISRSNRFIGFRINTIVGKDLIVIPKTEKGGTGSSDFSLEDEYLMDDMRSVENEDILLQSRTDKWKLAIESYKNYTITQKIFGTGFKYLSVYSGKTRTSNHPHCQIFAILLFSGLLGLTLYLSMFIYIVFLYFKYFKSLLLFFFLFFANLSLGFFSFSDFFGASFYIFLLIIPYLYHKLYKKSVFLSIEK